MAVYVLDQFASVAKSHVQGERLEGLNRRTVLIRADSPSTALRQAIKDAREREAINKSLLADDESFLSSMGLEGEYLDLYRAGPKAFVDFAYLGCSVPIVASLSEGDFESTRIIRTRTTAWGGDSLVGLLHEVDGFDDGIVERGSRACAELLFSVGRRAGTGVDVAQVLVLIIGDGSRLPDLIYRSASSLQVHAKEEMVLLGASGVSRVRAHMDLEEGQEVLDISVFSRGGRDFTARECVGDSGMDAEKGMT